ncbi:unnamed protein product [Polarella glacialis]|uniref:Uncharacterized protein n=1 Tax=Polarella glacialis TaxID=89957 RepID=A0A813JCS4_POLGL|nr:unnamed protein product [Polarella glacialis]
MVALAYGLDNSSSWFLEWAKVWKELGVQEILLDKASANEVVLQPAPMPGGLWSNRPISSSKVTERMRLFFKDKGCDAEDLAGLSSHSCKSTCLSWAAKIGLDKETRELLGNSVENSDVSALTYGRDNLAAPP